MTAYAVLFSSTNHISLSKSLHKLHIKINVHNVVMNVSTNALDLENVAAFSFTLLKGQTRFSELSGTKTTKPTYTNYTPL